MPQFSPTSQERLATCHPDLIRLFNTVITLTDCSIICGHRDEAAQTAAYELGMSKLKWPNSKHNYTPSRATDVVPYPLNWQDLEAFKRLALVVKNAATNLGILIEWGGDWTFRDMPHYQLPSP